MRFGLKTFLAAALACGLLAIIVMQSLRIRSLIGRLNSEDNQLLELRDEEHYAVYCKSMDWQRNQFLWKIAGTPKSSFKLHAFCGQLPYSLSDLPTDSVVLAEFTIESESPISFALNLVELEKGMFRPLLSIEDRIVLGNSIDMSSITNRPTKYAMIAGGKGDIGFWKRKLDQPTVLLRKDVYVEGIEKRDDTATGFVFWIE